MNSDETGGRLDLSGLVAARICHDLVSPLGAIGNGIELLAMAGPSSNGPELTLIAESTASATARARLFRLAFGTAARGQAMPAAEAMAALPPSKAGTRLDYQWKGELSVDRAEARLAMLCVLCLETAMPWGGEIRVGTDTDGWEISGTAARFRDLTSLWPLLSGTPPKQDISAAEVQFALAPLRAAELGCSLKVELGATGIRIAFGVDPARG